MTNEPKHTPGPVTGGSEDEVPEGYFVVYDVEYNTPVVPSGRKTMRAAIARHRATVLTPSELMLALSTYVRHMDPDAADVRSFTEVTI